MGDCHLDDLLDLLDQDDEFEENAKEEARNQNNDKIDNSMENTTEVTDHEKEALKKKTEGNGGADEDYQVPACHGSDLWKDCHRSGLVCI